MTNFSLLNFIRPKGSRLDEYGFEKLRAYIIFKGYLAGFHSVTTIYKEAKYIFDIDRPDPKSKADLEALSTDQLMS